MHTKEYYENRTYEQLAQEYKVPQQWNHKPAPTWNPKQFKEHVHQLQHEENTAKKQRKVPTKAQIEAALRLEEELWNS